MKKKAKEKEEKKGRREKCKLDRERRKLQKEKEKKVRKKPIPKKTGATKDGTENLTEQNNGSDESEAECPSCGLVYGCAEDDEMCDWCGQWWDIKCTTISDEDDIPDEFVCSGCN